MAHDLDIDVLLNPLVRHLHPDRKKRFREAFRVISDDPLQGKPLQEKLVGFFAYRVGSWRIVYSINHTKKIVHVVGLGPRDTIYENLEKDLISARLKK